MEAITRMECRLLHGYDLDFSPNKWWWKFGPALNLLLFLLLLLVILFLFLILLLGSLLSSGLFLSSSSICFFLAWASASFFSCSSVLIFSSSALFWAACFFSCSARISFLAACLSFNLLSSASSLARSSLHWLMYSRSWSFISDFFCWSSAVAMVMSDWSPRQG